MRRAGALTAYLLIAVLYTWPLVPLSGTRISGNAGDPILNTSVLWWNATNVPFSETWWNPPYYYPDHGVSTFTENLVGISLFASPIYWLTHNPLAAQNLSLYLAWPLSAFGVYLLVEWLTRRRDAAFLAGLVFGFTPYRTAELGHIQMVSSYWLPLALIGLHRYLTDRRARWLVLFGAGFALQALANGYMFFFGGVLIALWLAYFCSTRASWRALPPILFAWSIAVLSLMPVMLRYRAVHAEYNMHRVLEDPSGFSVPMGAWAQVSGVVWLWRHVFPDSDHNLFPGVAALVLVVAVGIRAMRQPAPAADAFRPARPGIRWAAAIVGAASVAITMYAMFVGPWRITIGHTVVRITNVPRAMTVALVCTIVVLWPLARLRMALARRSLWLFYTAATIAMAILSCGPQLRLSDHVTLSPAPYAWLLPLPGFNELRVPTRFWMLGVLCLGVAAGLSFVRIVPESSKRRRAALALVAAAVLVDGWMYSIPMAVPPVVWPIAEPAGGSRPILELPLGPDFDAAAAFRSIAHRRPVFNGASGYEPQHYAPLRAGLDARDPAMLAAIATFGEFDIVVNADDDPAGDLERYAAAAPGATLVARAGPRSTYRVPAIDSPDEMDPLLPIARVEVFEGDPAPITDGRLDTEWRCIPQTPGQWVMADLGTVRQVSGVSQALGEAARDFPRGLVIELSTDGAAWQEVWAGSGAAPAFRAAALAPLEAMMRFRFAPQPARFVHLRLTASHQNFWRVVELEVHGKATE